MWTLLLSRLNDPPGSFFDRRQIDMGQIKVGRSERTCDLVLPDDQGFVSREHCTISATGLDLFVTDTSKNGVALNNPGQRILPGQAVAIRPGDRLLINDFVIAVTTPAEAAGASFSAPPPPPLPQAGSTAGDDIWGAGPADPFLGDLGGSGTHDFLSGGGFSPAPAAPAFGADPFGGGLGGGGAFCLPVEPVFHDARSNPGRAGEHARGVRRLVGADFVSVPVDLDATVQRGAAVRDD